MLATLALLFAFQGEAILRQPLVIAMLAVPILLQVLFTPCTDLGLAAPHWTDAQPIDQMLAHPIPINRPIVETPCGTKLCRPSEAVLDLLPLPQKGPFSKEGCELLIDAEGRRVTGPV